MGIRCSSNNIIHLWRGSKTALKSLTSLTKFCSFLINFKPLTLSNPLLCKLIVLPQVAYQVLNAFVVCLMEEVSHQTKRKMTNNK
ncbi:hypothetical protein VIGAN_01170800 [Vigna angularis var. angularis]|uniref:Uncharacterized protein n=1 Tax=Vigna angularis var. angularis TaxID=157739 RepID=A0A0S3R0N4_PHAAN|nr:hypothetical protein VIGAN_01170800 [Vigna angularis var. angularis]